VADKKKPLNEGLLAICLAMGGTTTGYPQAAEAEDGQCLASLCCSWFLPANCGALYALQFTLQGVTACFLHFKQTIGYLRLLAGMA
jgi:hypothetical protein